MKRNDYISWDEYFMGVAILSSKRSKDPSTQVGACIVNKDKKIVGIGYNGFPHGVDDDAFPWGKEGNYIYYKTIKRKRKSNHALRFLFMDLTQRTCTKPSFFWTFERVRRAT